MISIIGVMIIFGVAFYTGSYGLWVWRQGNRRGAVGTFIIAWLTLVLPVWVWWFHQK